MQENQTQPTNAPAPITEDTKTIITAVALLIVFPIGFILMWAWTNWKRWVKWTITGCGCFPFLFLILWFFLAIIFGANPSEQIERAQQQTMEDTEQEMQQTACTMDAMMCPDGSYVGRSGPDCEFVCPTE